MSEPKTAPRARHLIVALICAAGTILALMGFNWIVDPYGIRPADSFLRLRLKSRRAIEKNEYLHKAYALCHERPETIYLGNSRVCVGLPADDFRWKSRVYNAGITSAEPEQILAYLRHALCLGSVRRVVIGLDAVTFVGPHHPPPTFDREILLQRAGDTMEPALVSPGIFSMTAVVDSAKTLLRQSQPEKVAYFRGVRDPDAMRSQIKGDSAWASRRVLEIGQRLLRTAAASDLKVDEARYEHAREIAELCRQHRVELIVFFLPIHEAYRALIAAEGLAPRVDQAKQKVSAIFREANLPGFILRDFSGALPQTADTNPEAVGSKIWSWWWEVSHFRTNLGELILDDLTSASSAANSPERKLQPN